MPSSRSEAYGGPGEVGQAAGELPSQALAISQPWQGKPDAPRSPHTAHLKDAPEQLTPSALRDVRLVDVDVPFERLVLFLFKFWFAQLVVGLVLVIVGGVVYALISAAAR